MTEFEQGVIETALLMEAERDKTMGHPSDALSLAEERFWKAVNRLVAERGT